MSGDHWTQTPTVTTVTRCSALSGHAEAPPVKLKEEKVDAVEAEPTIPSFPVLSSVDPPTVPSPAPAEASPVRSASVPLMPVCIKEEPRSPVHLNAELHPPAHAHSTTSDPAPASACSPGTCCTNGNPLFSAVVSCSPRLSIVHVRSFRHPSIPKEKPWTPPSRIRVGELRRACSRQRELVPRDDGAGRSDHQERRPVPA